MWSTDGRQLFYLAMENNRRLMAVDVQTEGSFVALNTTPMPIEGIVTAGARPYDMDRDGKHFLMMFPKAQADTTAGEQIHVVLNWFEELKRLVPAK